MSNDRDMQIIELLRSGHSGMEIAEKLGIGFSTVYYRIRTKRLRELTNRMDKESAKILLGLEPEVLKWFEEQAGELSHIDFIRAIIIDAYNEEMEQ